MNAHPPAFRPTAVALALAALATAAAAQQAAPPAASASAAGDTQAQVITVTATRRAERLQDVPLSVSTANDEQLRSAGVSSIQDISKVVSGVTFGNSPNDAGFRVRGVGTLGGFTSASEQPVGVVVDGVVMGLGPVLESMVDVERIEVLKGPQGTQFGKNASSGVVSITSRRPKLGRFEAEAAASFASLSERDVNGVLNVPLGEQVALRVSAFGRSYDGFIESVPRNETWGGQKAEGARAKLLFKASESLDVLLSFDTAHITTDGPGQLWTARSVPAAIAPVFSGIGIVPGADNLKSAENAEGFTKVDASGGAIEVNYKLGEFTLTSVTAHRERSGSQRYGLDSVPATVFEGGGNFVHRQDSQELRLTSPRGKVEYVAGMFWSRLKSRTADSAWLQPAELGAPAPPGLFTSVTGGINATATTSTSLAAFGDGKLRLDDTMSVLAGVRLTRDTVRALNTTDPASLVPEVGSPPGFLVPPSGRADQLGETSATKASGRLGFEYKPAKDTLLYATIARGYLGPTVTFSGQSGTRSDVKPQMVDDLTLGFKTEFMDRRLALNGSVFFDRYKNLQVGVFQASTSEFITENAGGMKSKGFELDASARFGGGFTGRASLTYADARFTDYVTACPATGDVSRCYTVGTTSLYQAGGDAVPGAPKITAAVGLDYGTAVAGLAVDASVNLSHRSKTSYGVGETAYVQAGYEVVNVAVKVGPEDERWHVALWARNLFDKHYQSAIIGMPFAPPGGVVNWNTRDARRTLGVTVGVKF